MEKTTTMINKNYEYDVAFSFVVDDEELAKKLNDQIKNRMKTFIYFDQQKELAGKDGEETFNRVFGTAARIVVILYRKKWGTTSWTRIEETAIKNRGYDEGYDFVILIPLDKPPTTPRWLPKTRIWIGLDRWGIDATAAVIEGRVQEHGGAPREETIEEYAGRIKQELEKKQKQKNFLKSTEGVQKAEHEFKNIYKEIKRLCTAISNSDNQIRFTVEEFNIKYFSVYINNPFYVNLEWKNSYIDTLYKSELLMHLCKVSSRADARWNQDKLKTEIFEFEIINSNEFGWRMKTGDKRFYSSKQLADYSVRMLIDKF